MLFSFYCTLIIKLIEQQSIDLRARNTEYYLYQQDCFILLQNDPLTNASYKFINVISMLIVGTARMVTFVHVKLVFLETENIVLVSKRVKMHKL